MKQCPLQQYGWIQRLSDQVKLSQKERQISHDITYTQNLKYDTNELRCKTEKTHRHRKQTYGYKGERGLGRDKLEVWDEQTTIYKTDKEQVLLYSTGNYIQYPIINHNGKESKKEYIYI